MQAGHVIWQLPVKDTERYIPSNVKYHCFDDGASLCGKYNQDTDYFETDIESGEILSRPQIACKACFRKWKKESYL